MAFYTVTAGSLRLRSGPGTNYFVIGLLSKNNIVEGSESNGDWVKVITSDKKEGWSHRDYLQLIAEEPIPPSEGVSFRVKINALNVRQGPGMNFAVVGIIKLNDVMTGLARSADNQWAKIFFQSKNITGWCSVQYMTKISNPTPTPTPDPIPEPSPTPTPDPQPEPTPSPEPIPVPPPVVVSFRVTASSLNIRQGPGTNFSVVGGVKLGDIVDGLAMSADNQWAQIVSESHVTGWCSLKYLAKISEPPPTPEPTPQPQPGPEPVPEPIPKPQPEPEPVPEPIPKPQPEPTPAPDPSKTVYRVDASTLNVRHGPGPTYDTVGTLLLGDLVEGLSISADNQWAQIHSAFKNLTGWCSLKYLTQMTPPPPPSAEDVKMFVTSDTLNYRAGPLEAYPIIGTLKQGDPVIFLSSTSDWRWVNIKLSNNTTGWASSKSLTESNDLFASDENYPKTGLHRALSDAIPLRAEPNETASEVTIMKFNRVVKVDTISSDGKWKHCTNAWGEEGWYPIERLEQLSDDVVIPHGTSELPWLSVAFSQFGTREVPGPKYNPRIVEYLMSTDLAEKYPFLPDETDWCAGFVNWCIKKVKIPVTNSAVVNPWRQWGKASVPPQRGALTTFLWDDGWAHVSFYLGDVGNYVICLGGNQSDAVWISVYHKKYVTSYRIY